MEYSRDQAMRSGNAGAGFKAALHEGANNWPGIVKALRETGYQGYLTFEYFAPYAHYPEALVFQTSDAMDRILGRG